MPVSRSHIHTGSNFREMLVRAEWRKKLDGERHLSYATLGQDTGAYSWGSNIFRPESDRYSADGVRPDNYGYFADPVEVNILFAEIIAAWTIDPRSGLRVEAAYVLRSRQPHGAANETTNWFRIGISANLRQRYHDQEVRYELE
ncbi:MAG: hypothetical protein IPG92_18035 [Flavobacteriales bacterium]|nr:hypothetical protein [Flavobacteriales bacterium]